MYNHRFEETELLKNTAIRMAIAFTNVTNLFTQLDLFTMKGG
jgi:hypothetical protein